MLAKVDEIHVARGKRVIHVDLRKSRPAKSESASRLGKSNPKVALGASSAN